MIKRLKLKEIKKEIKDLDQKNRKDIINHHNI